MVARMNTNRCIALAVLAAGALQSHANELPDPTRPPAAMLAAPAAAASAPADAPQLQSVLLGKGRRPAAVISGQLVLLGGQLGDTTLVRVTERGAVLKGPQGETMLALTPAANPPGTSLSSEPTR
jgi:MSHA biogenesis protein MshK